MRKWQLFRLGAFFLVLAGSPALFGQGCSLCRDATAGSAPQARKSLRLAIPFLAIPAAGMFSAILYASLSAKTKTRPQQETNSISTESSN